MKRFFAMLTAGALLLTLLPGCASKKTGANVVNVYNWGEYIDESIFDTFEEETGIRVNYQTFESNEQLYSILKQGGSSYDVIIPSDYMISRLIAEDMLMELDRSKIPNLSLLDPAYLHMDYDPEGRYTVPYTWGTVGIIYNANVVTEPVDSWGILWDARYTGEILQFNNSRDAMMTALLYLGYSQNTTDPQQLQEAYDLLKKQKPLLQKYVMDQCYDLLEGGEAAVGAYYAGDYLCMLENNPDLRFVIPKEGTNLFCDAMCIPTCAQNVENAQAFINFMCRTDISLLNLDATGYASPNLEAAELYQENYDLSDAEDAYEYDILFPSKEKLKNSEVYVNLPEDTLTLYNDLWTLLKS